MQIEYDFVDVDASDSLEEYIKEQLALAIPGLSRHDGLIVIHLAQESAETSHMAPEFQCEIAAFESSKTQPVLRVYKSHEDLLHAISQAVNAFKVAYRNDHRNEPTKDSRREIPAENDLQRGEVSRLG